MAAAQLPAAQGNERLVFQAVCLLLQQAVPEAPQPRPSHVQQQLPRLLQHHCCWRAARQAWQGKCKCS